MHAAAGDVKEFRGVLVSRKYRPGRKYIQLLFQAGDDLRLCLSQDIDLVRRLQPGQMYQVRGPEYVIGQKPCVCDPLIGLVEPSTGKKRVWFAVGATCLVLLLGMGGVLAMQSPAPPEKSRDPVPTTKQSQQTLSEQTEEPAPDTADTTPSATQQTPPITTPTTTPVTPSPTTTRTSGRRAPSTSTPSTQTTQPTAPAQASVQPSPSPPVPEEETPPEPPPEEPPAEPPADPTTP
jgi:hypothetical protein